MKFLILFLLIPSMALASWEVEVIDKQTREVKKYQLSTKETFQVPIGIKSVYCFSPEESSQIIEDKIVFTRQLQCDYSNFSVFVIAYKIFNNDYFLPTSLSVYKDKKEFLIILKYT